MENERPIHDKNVRQAVYTAFTGRCFYSGKKLTLKEMHIDHFIPTSKGGTNTFDNYVLCRDDINTSKHSFHKPDTEEFLGALYLIKHKYAVKAEECYQRIIAKNKKNTSGRQKAKISDSKIFYRARLEYKRLAVAERVILRYLNPLLPFDFYNDGRLKGANLKFPKDWCITKRYKYADYVFNNSRFSIRKPLYGGFFGVNITTFLENIDPDRGEYYIHGVMFRYGCYTKALLLLDTSRFPSIYTSRLKSIIENLMFVEHKYVPKTSEKPIINNIKQRIGLVNNRQDLAEFLYSLNNDCEHDGDSK